MFVRGWELVRKAILIASLVAVGAVPACGAEAGAAMLVWPTSRQPVTDGGEVQLWEDFHLDPAPMAIPCQATPYSTVVVNAQSVDEIREREAPTWFECGSVAVTGGWAAIGFDERSMRAVAFPAIMLGEPNGCSYKLDEIEGHEDAPARYAWWTVNGAATLTGSPPSSAASPCAPELPLTGTVELMGPQAGGYGVIPWGLSAPPCGESEAVAAAKELSQRMVTATRLAKLGRLFPSVADAPFSATGAGTLVVTWYVAGGGGHSARADGASGELVARAATVFSSSGTKRVRADLTRRGRRLLRHSRHVMLGLRASFTPHGSTAIIVTGAWALGHELP